MDQEQLMQLVQIYSQMVGADPNQLIQELSQMDEQQLGQAVQQMMSTVQQSQGGGQEQPQPQEGMAPYNAQEYMGGGQEQPQPEMRRGGYYRQYLQDGSTVGKPNRTIQIVTMADGSTGQYDPTIHSDLTPVEYNVYGEGNNTRMVPVSALVSNTNAATNPYMTGTYNQAEYTSEGQNAIKDEQGARGFAAPVNASDISKDELERIQQVLVDSGYDIGKYGAKKNGVDGLMGKKTAEALRRFEYEDPTAYAQFINLNTSNLPKASVKPSSASKKTSSSIMKEPYKRETYNSEQLEMKKFKSMVNDFKITRDTVGQFSTQMLREGVRDIPMNGEAMSLIRAELKRRGAIGATATNTITSASVAKMSDKEIEKLLQQGVSSSANDVIAREQIRRKRAAASNQKGRNSNYTSDPLNRNKLPSGKLDTLDYDIWGTIAGGAIGKGLSNVVGNAFGNFGKVLQNGQKALSNAQKALPNGQKALPLGDDALRVARELVSTVNKNGALSKLTPQQRKMYEYATEILKKNAR